jgi:lactoylglutathione lyase
MRYLHTDIDKSLDFYCNKLGMKEVRRVTNTEKAPLLELAYNRAPEAYRGGRNFGHLAHEVDDNYALCDRLMKAGAP